VNRDHSRRPVCHRGHYWTENDYVDAVGQVGLAVITIDYLGPYDPAAWSTDEASIPPCIVIEARKARDRVT